VPTQKQRRDAARRHLERQLQRRAEQEAARKRFALIASIVGTLIVIAIVVVLIVVMGGSDKKPAASGKGSTTPAPTTSTTAAASACPTGNSPVPVAKGTGPLTTFDGVTVRNGTDMAHNPAVGSKASTPPAKLEYKDLVVGKGKAATPSSTVSVQYTGVLYCDGTPFDTPATHGDKPISVSLTGVVPGFTQGIGGTTGVPPMKVGGRRIIIMPADLAYGPQANGSIPANAPLVFLVDLKSIS
jgi:peptidylprolyl isomerase